MILNQHMILTKHAVKWQIQATHIQIYYCEVVNHVTLYAIDRVVLDYVLHHPNGLGNTAAIYLKKQKRIKFQENYFLFNIYPCIDRIGHVP